MTYAEALHLLGAARRFGMKLGLEPMRGLARALGSPQERLRFIHLAGTNGKGSTAAFCESCLRAAGRRVGLYTSPHLVSVRERIQVDRRPIPEADFAAGIGAVREAMGESPGTFTFFEIMTALALWYFAREKVDWVVWETGLGGRLDATNIVQPEAVIITNIGLDHQEYLGRSLEEIAAEKAGIIKPGVPVTSGVEPGPAAEIVARRARETNSLLTVVPRDFAVENPGWRGGRQMARIDGHDFALGLAGPHQVQNAGCAIAALRRLPGEMISTDAVTRGLEGTSWPGRFEIISESPLIVLDGAHNTAGAIRLMETWRKFLEVRGLAPGTHLVFASVTDKDIAGIARLLRPAARQVSLVRLDSERSCEPVALAGCFSGLPCALYGSVSELWPDLLRAAGPLPILITGSLFLVGEVLAQQHGSTEEYRLNERLAIPLVR
jgi:dihydrofolate synthase/folylpolyglutamate synthase